MKKRRKVIVNHIDKTPLNKRAFAKLVRYYYKGHHDIKVNFSNEITCCAEHEYDSKSQTHTITISPRHCSHFTKDEVKKNFETLINSRDLVELDNYDTVCNIIVVVLHEIKHATQCDGNPIRWARCDDDAHPTITNVALGYYLSDAEAEAEGWALINFNRALKRYERWIDE